MGSRDWMHLTVRRGVTSLVLLTALIYVNSLGGGFIWDDEYMYLDNPHLLEVTIKSAFTSDLYAHSDIKERYYAYRPIALLAYSWQARIFGIQPFAFHMVSLAFHALAGVMLFLLVLEFAEIRVAWFTAALFVAHPLHVEAVAWMAAFSEVLAGALVIASLYTLVRARGPQRKLQARGPRWLLGISYLAAAGAFLTKETAMPLPLLAALIVGWRAWPFFVIAAGTIAARYMVMGWASAVLPNRTLWRHASIAGATALHYFKKMIWPWPVAPEYDFSHSMATWAVFAIAAALAGLLAYRYSHLRLAVLVLVISLGPALASSIVMASLQLARDRNAYLAIMGFTLLIGYATRLRGVAPAALVLVALWSVLSVAAIGHWRDSEALWTYTLKVTPNSKTAVSNLGYWYFSTMQFAEADRIYQHGLQFRPNDPDFLKSLDAVRKAWNPGSQRPGAFAPGGRWPPDTAASPLRTTPAP